jgi:hypothetical protein
MSETQYYTKHLENLAGALVGILLICAGPVMAALGWIGN